MSSEENLFYEEDLETHKALVRAKYGPPMKSTMGHPLSPSEESHIRDSWQAFQEFCLTVPQLTPDTVQMVGIVQDMIAHCHEVRRAVYDGWRAANARGIPDKPRESIAKRALADVRALGFSNQQILDLVAEIRAREESK